MNARMLPFFVASAFLACSEADPLPGQEGGACRVSLEPCDAPLICSSGGCRAPSAEPETAVSVQWSFPLMGGRDRLEADGVDSLVVQATLTDRATGELMPQNFGFRMWVEPPEAGTLAILRDFNPIDAEGRWSLLDAEGRAVAKFTSCDKTQPGCVRYAAIRMSVEPRPLSTIDQVIVENIGAAVPGGGGAGGAGGGGGDGGGAGGGGVQELPPLGTCPVDRVKVNVGGQLREIEVTQLQLRNIEARKVNLTLANPGLNAAALFSFDTTNLDEDIGIRTYSKMELESGADLTFSALLERVSLCSRFKADRLVIEKLVITDDNLSAFAAQLGGYCDGEGEPVSVCLHWESP